MRGDHVAWQKFVATLRLLPWRPVWRSGEIARSGLLMESRSSMEVGAMAIEDRRDVVSIVEETHGLIGNSLATDVLSFLVLRVDQQRTDDLGTATRLHRRSFGRAVRRSRAFRSATGAEDRRFSTRTER